MPVDNYRVKAKGGFMGVTIRQKQKGKGKPWWIFVSHLGKRTSRQIGDKKAAETVASKLRAKLQLGDFSIFEEQKPDPTFGEYAKSWIEITVPATCKESTLSDYNDILDNHILPVFKNELVTEIKRKKIKDFLLEKINKGYANSTVTHMKNVISGVLNDAVDDEVIDANPVYRIKYTNNKEDKSKDVNPLTAKELDHLLKTAQKHYADNYVLFLLLSRTGLRIGEALALEWGDINYKNRYIEVKRSIVRGRISSPKNGKQRRVDMSLQLTEALKERMDGIKLRLVVPDEEKPNLVFPNTQGGYIDKNNWRRRVFKKALEKAKSRKVRIHDLRHTYATLRIAKGDNIADVSNQLGHHSVKLTLDVYHHWMPGDKKSEVDALDNLHSDAPHTHPTIKKGLAVNS